MFTHLTRENLSFLELRGRLSCIQRVSFAVAVRRGPAPITVITGSDGTITFPTGFFPLSGGAQSWVQKEKQDEYHFGKNLETPLLNLVEPAELEQLLSFVYPRKSWFLLSFSSTVGDFSKR